MKKVLVTALVVSSALFILVEQANAEEVGNEQSELGIRFDTDGPVKPGPGPYKDNLALIWSPSKFDFGRQKATANIATYSNTVAGDQYIVVNDDRASNTDGNTSAWKVTAKLSKIVSSDDSATELPAKLQFSLGDAQSYSIGSIDSDTNDYTPNSITGNLGTLASNNDISVTKNVTLEAGQTTATNIIGKTKSNAVKGGFATKLADSKLTVTTGNGAAGKSFKGSVTWSLDNTY